MVPADKPLVWLHGEVKTPPFSKKTQTTPQPVIEVCQRRLRLYDELIRDSEEDQ